MKREDKCHWVHFRVTDSSAVCVNRTNDCVNCQSGWAVILWIITKGRNAELYRSTVSEPSCQSFPCGFIVGNKWGQRPCHYTVMKYLCRMYFFTVGLPSLLFKEINCDAFYCILMYVCVWESTREGKGESTYSENSPQIQAAAYKTSQMPFRCMLPVSRWALSSRVAIWATAKARMALTRIATSSIWEAIRWPCRVPSNRVSSTRILMYLSSRHGEGQLYTMSMIANTKSEWNIRQCCCGVRLTIQS